jgi:hypothetical protein
MPCMHEGGKVSQSVKSGTLKRFLRESKRKIGKVASHNFWTRYALLAPYLALRAGIASVTGKTGAGSTHATNSIADALKYISGVFDDYKHIAGVTRFPGKIAEIGPGDSCGVALRFLASGSEHIDLLDRFFSPRDVAQQREINQQICSEHSELQSRLMDDTYSEASFRGLQRNYGEDAAAEAFFRANNGYSTIVSRAVLEHLYDPLTALKLSADALVPAGFMIHFVDCRDHGLFSTQWHELKFLELPQVLYSPLKWRGGPNRIRLSSYVEVLKRSPVEFSIYVRHLAGVPQDIPEKTTFEQIDKSLLDKSRAYVASVRRKLARPYAGTDERDLMVQGFCIYARRTS